MKVKILEKEPEDEQVVFLDLLPSKTGVQVIAHDKKEGSSWRLVTISEDGVYLHQGVGEQLGFALDCFKQLKVTKREDQKNED